MSHLKRVNKTLNSIQAIPKESLATKVKKTFTGTLIVGFGIFGAVKLSFPWYVSAGFVLFGATVWSSELVTLPFKLFANFLADMVAASRGIKPGDTNGTS